jgi:hypothetical protein
MRWLDHVIAVALNFFASAQIFSNFFTSPVAQRMRTALEIPNGCRWSAGEHATQQTRNPRSAMNN